MGGKSGRCVGLTTLPPSYADCLEIWEPQPPGTLRACPGLNGIALPLPPEQELLSTINTLHRKTVYTFYIRHRLTNLPFAFQEAEGTWQFFMLKVVDLLDTVCNHLYYYNCNIS